MEKILVLMATYNGEKYLQEQLDSIYKQKGIEVDILVRDDGSKDNTISILKDNEKKHSLKWYQGKHCNVQGGFFELMQKAANMNYNYFAFSDQDDVWDDDKLLIAYKNICNNSGCALYYSGQRLVDENLKFIENHELNKKRSLKSRFVLSDFAGCTGVFNRKLLEETIMFKPNYMLMHDTWILRICICLGGRVVIDSEPHMNYRQHIGNTVGLKHGILATFKQVRQYIYEYHIEKLTKELLLGYKDKMLPEYREVANWICNYKIDREARKKLLDKRNVDFCNKGLNLTYKLKIMMRRL